MHSIYTSLLPRDTTYDSIRIIVNTEDARERDYLTEQWRTHKLEELNFVGIVVRKMLDILWIPLLLRRGFDTKYSPWLFTNRLC